MKQDLWLVVRTCVVLIASCGAAGLFAETWTWKGADGASWLEASSWEAAGGGTGVPSGTDTVVFDGTTGTVALNGATSIGAFTTLNGATFTVSGTGSITLANAKTIFDLAASSDVSLDVTLAGDAQLYVQGKATATTKLRLKKDNTFTGGVELKDAASSSASKLNNLYVYTSQALGVPGEGKLIKAHTYTRYTFCSSAAMTLDYDLWSDETFNDAISFVFSCPSATINGTVSFNDRVSTSHEGVGPYTYKKGLTVRNPKKDYCMFRGNNTNNPRLVFDDLVTGELYWHAGSGFAYYVFNASGNTPGTFPFEAMKYGKIVCGAAEAFGPTTQFEMYSSTASLDLNGFDQTVTKFFGPSGTLKNTAAQAATFFHAYDGTSKVTTSGKAIAHFFNGRTDGALNYVFAPTVANYTYGMTNVTWNATGAFIVSNGTLKVVSQALPNVASVSVADGGTLELARGSSLNNAATLTVENGGTLRLDALTKLIVDACTIRGVKIQRGRTYAGGDLPGLEGDGTVSVRLGEVTQSSADWTGAGSDTKITTKENWENDTLPEWLTGGLFTRVTGGAAMTLTEDVQFAGLSFAGGANPFMVAAATGSETLSLYDKGLMTCTPAAPDTVQTNVITAPLYFGAAQAIDVAGNSVLELAGPMATLGSVVLVKGGAGALHIKNAIVNYGDFTHTNGDVHVWRGGTLGSAESGAVKWIRKKGLIKPRFILHDGAILPRPLQMEIDAGNDAGDTGEIIATDGTAEISGKITRMLGNLILEARPDTTLVLSGGLTGNWFMPRGEGVVVFTNTPITRTANNIRSTIAAYNSGTTYVYSQNNDCEEVSIGNYSTPIRIHLMAENVFKPATTGIRFGGAAGNNRVIHLHGHNQSFGSFGHTPNSPGIGSCITSDAPVTITVLQQNTTLYSGPATNAVPLCGPISLVKNGSNLLRLQGSQNLMGGSIRAGAARLELNTAFPLVPAMSVANGATLAFCKSDVTTRATDVTIEDGGTLELAAGTANEIGALYFGAQLAKNGTWGSSASPAKYRDDTRFTGTGVVRVRNGIPAGTLFVVR